MAHEGLSHLMTTRGFMDVDLKVWCAILSDANALRPIRSELFDRNLESKLLGGGGSRYEAQQPTHHHALDGVIAFYGTLGSVHTRSPR